MQKIGIHRKRKYRRPIIIFDITESKVALVYGQMNEAPGARMRVGLTALTMAEYFRDVNEQDVLLFIDNIFRFVQAGSEVSALLGRMPSTVGYQPNLSTEMGTLQERITSTKEGSITSIQAVYVPADDLTDPLIRSCRNKVQVYRSVRMPQLHTSLHFHLTPIVMINGSSRRDLLLNSQNFCRSIPAGAENPSLSRLCYRKLWGSRNRRALILGWAYYLDAFSSYPLRT
ncbi:uncharacterized protein LOC111393010 [Olea europaea var. sylvestris]|uniref:uncharacterized protein LOC111393010 n=1 Tax=Olea europaea var. sylvestris TaxID=158386 RepID=UPI000C1D8C95|nr:uncharacterized protein LOC111393010 [Olea europaea var. sylvestris]